MRFTTQQSDFSSAISTVQKALRAGSLSAMMDGIFLEARDDQIRLLCTDMNLEIEAKCSADITEGGCIVLPGRLFGDLIRKLPEGEVTLETKDTSAVINAAHYKSSIQGMSGSSYPEMPLQPAKISFGVPSKKLRDMIRQTRFACSTDESRQALTGVLFETSGDTLRLVAIDGYRLAIREAAASIEGDGRFIVPASSLREIQATLLDSDDEVKVSFSNTIVVVNMGSAIIKSTLVSGEYMKYESILPKEHQSRIRVNKRDLMQSIDRASLMANETRNNLVKFTIAGEKMVVTASSEQGSVEDDLAIQQIGEDIEIAFNSKYMSEVLRALDEDEIYIDFNNSVSPAVIKSTGEGRFTYLVLPVRLFQS